MNKITNILKELVTPQGLYCVWIRARDEENAPLIRVWIDSSMTKFETGAKIDEADLEAVRAETLAALSEDETS